MKTTITNISIAEPCSQNWEQMEKRGEHNFCEACNKCVVDFSSYTNEEIIKTLTHADSDVCGRLSQTQLNQLSYHLVVAPTQRNWMKYLGVLAIGASVFMQNTHVLASAKLETTLSVIKKKADDPKPEPVKVIYGYVIKENKQPALAGVKVVIANTKLFAFIDAKGHYEIKLDKGFNYKNDRLIIENTKNELTLNIDYSTSKQKDMVLITYNPMIVGRMIMKMK
jgi:hypothetical protein